MKPTRKRTKKSDTENEPEKTVDELAKIYGEPHDLNGATVYYIKEASVFTTKIVPDGYTFINFGYASEIDAMEQVVVNSHWIGFDSSAHQFPDGAFLRIQAITQCNNFEYYENYFAAIDEAHRTKDTVDIFRIWIEDANGSEIKTYDAPVDWFIDMKESSSEFKAYGIERYEDKVLDVTKAQMSFPHISERTFLSIRADGPCNAIVIFEE